MNYNDIEKMLVVTKQIYTTIYGLAWTRFHDDR